MGEINSSGQEKKCLFSYRKREEEGEGGVFVSCLASSFGPSCLGPGVPESKEAEKEGGESKRLRRHLSFKGPILPLIN